MNTGKNLTKSQSKLFVISGLIYSFIFMKFNSRQIYPKSANILRIYSVVSHKCLYFQFGFKIDIINHQVHFANVSQQ